MQGRLAASLRAYLNDRAVPSGAAYRVLRGAFLAAFAAQAAVAAAVALAAVALAGRNVAPSPWIALVLIVAAAGQVALGAVVGAYGVRQAGRLARGLALHRPDARTSDPPTSDPPTSDARTSEAPTGDGSVSDARTSEAPTGDAPVDDGAEPELDEHRRIRVARSAALSQTLLSAVLLSTPSWFVAFAWATGQSAVTLLGLLATAGLGIAFGTMQIGPLARAVTVRRG